MAVSVGPVETAERYGRVSVDLGIRITKISKPPTFSLTHSLGPVRRRQPHHRWKTCPEERTRFVRGALGRGRAPELRWHGAVLTSTTDDRRQTCARAPRLSLFPPGASRATQLDSTLTRAMRYALRAPLARQAIQENLVLTAAHCVDFVENPRKTKVYVAKGNIKYDRDNDQF